MVNKSASRAMVVLSCVLVTVIGTAVPGAAGPVGAMNRCNAGGSFDAGVSVWVPGTGSTFVGGGPQQPADTPLVNQMRPGDVLRVTAGGSVSYGGIFNWYGTWGPDGNGQAAPASSAWPFPGPAGRQFALVGRFNQNSQNVALGTASACMFVPSGGDGVSIPWALWLWPNDDYRLDNGGGYWATVLVWQAARSSP
jgi:hypothetical protein